MSCVARALGFDGLCGANLDIFSAFMRGLCGANLDIFSAFMRGASEGEIQGRFKGG